MKYQLFAMKPTAENLTRAAKGYYRATPGYLLVYTHQRRPGKSVDVKVEQLSPADLAWLEECNREILTDTVNRDRNVQKKMLNFLDSMKTELAAEEAKIKGVDHA